MKNTTLVLLSAMTIGAFAQKTDKVKIKYEFDMYPLNTISKEKVADIIVTLDYVQKVEAAKADLAAKQEQARLQKEEYDKKKFGQKYLEKNILGEAKPTGVYNSNQFIPTLFNSTELEGMISIPGFTQKDGATCIVNAQFSEFMPTVNPSGITVTYAPLKVKLSITNDKGVSVFQGDLPNNSTNITFTATGNQNLGANYNSTMQTLETNAKNLAVTNLNNYLKTNYGFNVVKDDCPFFDVKDKAFQYADYHEAIQKLEVAFMSVNMPERQEKFTTTLKECVAIWETNMKELNKTDKKAKINKDVAAATTINLALAYTWLKDFSKAYDYLADHKMLDEDYSRAYDDASKLLKDYDARYSKYSKY
jgi:hypothetical protein